MPTLTGESGPLASSHDLVAHPAVGRLCANFTAGVIERVTKVTGGDFVDAVIRMAILDANTRHIWTDEVANRRFAGFEEGLPDDLRRAVSIHSISNSLSLPFETVRRRVRSLSDQGMCSLVKRGVMITRDQVSDDAMRSLSEWIYDAARQLYLDLRSLQPQFDPFREAGNALAPMDPCPAPVRMVSRAGLAHVLRYIEAAKDIAGNLRDSIILLFVFVANVEHELRGFGGGGAAPDTIMDDARRKRIPVFALARSMGLVPETARRRINILVAQGLCVRDERGVIVPAAVLASPRMIAHRDRNLASVQRMFAELRRAGVRLD